MTLYRPEKYYQQFREENKKAFYLAFLRVSLSVWLLVELYVNRCCEQMQYGAEKFVVNTHKTTGAIINISFAFVNNHLALLIYAFVILCILNLLGIGKWCTALLLFLITDLFQKINEPCVNGGDKMARLVLFYLIFADSYQYFVLIKNKNSNGDKQKIINLLSNVSAYSIMIQLCVAYFFSAVAKLQTEAWRNGEAVYYAFMMERFAGTSLNYKLAHSKLFVTGATYFVLLFELLFPFLIWVKKFRLPFIVMGVIVHIGIYIFMMIYGFQVIFILLYGLFFTNEQVLQIVNRFLKKSNLKKQIIA